MKLVGPFLSKDIKWNWGEGETVMIFAESNRSIVGGWANPICRWVGPASINTLYLGSLLACDWLSMRVNTRHLLTAGVR